jgi:hypothetical protein
MVHLLHTNTVDLYIAIMIPSTVHSSTSLVIHVTPFWLTFVALCMARLQAGCTQIIG